MHTSHGTKGCAQVHDLWFASNATNGRPAGKPSFWSGLYSTHLYSDFVVNHLLAYAIFAPQYFGCPLFALFMRFP